MDINNAAGRRFLCPVAFFKDPVKDSIVKSHNPLLLGFGFEEGFVRRFVRILAFWFLIVHG
jgi:hypothetical protein